MSGLIKKLANKFVDKEYAHAYMESHTLSRIAGQIYALRKSRDWSQKELAERANVSQERICKLECGDFDSLTLKSLWKLSEAFDVHLHVSFDSFRHGMLDVANLHPSKLDVASREQDLSHLRKFQLFNHGGEWKVVQQNPFIGKSERVGTIQAKEIKVKKQEWYLVNDASQYEYEAAL